MSALEKSFEMPLLSEQLSEEQGLEALLQASEASVDSGIAIVNDWLSGSGRNHRLIKILNDENQLVRVIESIPVSCYQQDSSILSYSDTYPEDAFYFNYKKQLVLIKMHGDQCNRFVATREWKRYGPIQIGWSPYDVPNKVLKPDSYLWDEKKAAYCRLKSNIVKTLMSTDIYRQVFHRLESFIEEQQLSESIIGVSQLTIKIFGPIKYGIGFFRVALIHSDGKDRSDVLSQAFISQSQTTRVAPFFFVGTI